MAMVILALLMSAQGAPTSDSTKPLILQASSRSGEAAAVLTISADGLIEKCLPADRPYWNIPAPPDLCESFPVGQRYSAPAIYKGKPQRRKITIRISTTDVNIK